MSADAVDDMDFLLADDAGQVAIQQTLEQSRAAIAHWAAKVLIVRHPDIDDAASARGRRLWQQELDRHLRKLQETWDDASALGLYADWVRRRRLAQGGRSESLALAMTVLCEGLARHLEPDLARPLVAATVGAFVIPLRPGVATYVGLP